MRLLRNFGNFERATETVYSQEVMAMIGSANIVIHCIVAVGGVEVWNRVARGRVLEVGEDRSEATLH